MSNAFNFVFFIYNNNVFLTSLNVFNVLFSSGDGGNYLAPHRYQGTGELLPRAFLGQLLLLNPFRISELIESVG